MNNVLYFNQASYNTRFVQITQGAERLQSLINEFYQLNLPFKLKTTGELAELVRNGEEFIKAKISETIEQPMLGFFKVKKSYLVNQLDLPNFDKLNELATECLQFVNGIHYYSFSSAKLSIDAKAIDNLKKTYSVIAETPEQIKLAEAHVKAAEAMTEFNKCLLAAMDQSVYVEEQFGKYFCYEGKGLVLNDYFYNTNSFKID